jgi:pimeloyl-ACP methyl ester carboxylesterase
MVLLSMNIIMFYLILLTIPAGLSSKINMEIIPMEPLKMQYKISGEGTPLILIPGGLTGWVSWDPFVSEFTDIYKVVQMQLLNVQYGMEDKDLPDDYSVKTESEALFESLKETGIKAPADFIGWSFGAMVLLDFALNYPHLIRSLTLIEPPAYWILKANKRVSKETEEVMMFLKTLRGEITENQLERFMIGVGFAPPGTPLRNHPRWTTWVMFRNSLRNSGQVVMHEDDLARLRNFQSPVLLVKGTGSTHYLHEVIELLNHDLPDSHIIELDGGHAPHIFSKDEFVSIIRKFHKEN